MGYLFLLFIVPRARGDDQERVHGAAWSTPWYWIIYDELEQVVAVKACSQHLNRTELGSQTGFRGLQCERSHWNTRVQN